jgi:hypothetical protein
MISEIHGLAGSLHQRDNEIIEFARPVSAVIGAGRMPVALEVSIPT